MSLIICRKENDTLLVVSDTKLTYPTDQFPEKQTGHPSDGVIKTIIINPTLCISFAGDIESAEEGIKQIQATDDLSLVFKVLANSSQGKQTDFIVCTSKPDVKIFEIKNATCSEVQQSWIGSANAFSRFQGYFNNQIQEDKGQPASMIKIEPSIGGAGYSLGKVSSAFDKVIDDTSIPEVDGFRVMVIVENGVFRYRGYMHNYMGILEIKIEPRMIGKEIPIGHGNAGDGSFMINFFSSNSNHNNVAVHILQGGIGIIYSRRDNGLLRPTIYQMDEVEFVDFAKEKFDLRPTMITHLEEPSYFHKAEAYFKRNDFTAAIKWFDKVLKLEKAKMKAKAHYGKGVSLLNLRRSQEGVIEIQKAIDLDSGYQKVAMKLMRQLWKL